MKSMVMYSSKPRKMLYFSTTKVDNVNVLCIDPATEKLTFYAAKSSKSKENSQTSNHQSWFLSLTLHPQVSFLLQTSTGSQECILNRPVNQKPIKMKTAEKIKMLRICSGQEEIRMAGFCDLGGVIIPLNPKIIVLKAAVYTACKSLPRARLILQTGCLEHLAPCVMTKISFSSYSTSFILFKMLSRQFTGTR